MRNPLDSHHTPVGYSDSWPIFAGTTTSRTSSGERSSPTPSRTSSMASRAILFKARSLHRPAKGCLPRRSTCCGDSSISCLATCWYVAWGAFSSVRRGTSSFSGWASSRRRSCSHVRSGGCTGGLAEIPSFRRNEARAPVVTALVASVPRLNVAFAVTRLPRGVNGSHHGRGRRIVEWNVHAVGCGAAHATKAVVGARARVRTHGRDQVRAGCNALLLLALHSRTAHRRRKVRSVPRLGRAHVRQMLRHDARHGRAGLEHATIAAHAARKSALDRFALCVLDREPGSATARAGAVVDGHTAVLSPGDHLECYGRLGAHRAPAARATIRRTAAACATIRRIAAACATVGRIARGHRAAAPCESDEHRDGHRWSRATVHHRQSSEDS